MGGSFKHQAMSLLLRNGRILSCKSGQLVERSWLLIEDLGNGSARSWWFLGGQEFGLLAKGTQRRLRFWGRFGFWAAC